ELRTPLNSLLILSDELSKNSGKNLTLKQVEFAKTIHASGNDLLALINDILDLSKIESGTVIVDISDVALRDLHDYVDRTFRHVAESKKLEFEVMRDPELPRVIQTDAKRLQQILKNLLSNAFKFTERGRVSLSIARVQEGWNPENDVLNRAKSVLAFSVTDTGIGIAPDKQQIIFEAFQQADGSTSRKYGGTGLGLAISREIARLLGGEIRLESAPGEGSTFVLYLPQNYMPVKTMKRAAEGAPSNLIMLPEATDVPAVVEETPGNTVSCDDDASVITPEDRVLLIIENDPSFAQFLLETAHEWNFKGIIATRGADALAIVRQQKVDAITLDIKLTDLDGWRVLARLKDDPATRHIPVHIITTEEERERGLRMGAIGALTKPLKSKESLRKVFATIQGYIEPHTKHLLIAGKDEEHRKELIELVSGSDIEIAVVSTGPDALAKLRDGNFNAAVVMLELEDTSGLNLIEEMKKDNHLGEVPLIIYVSRNLSKKDEAHLKRLGQTMNLKEARSPERLLDECALFLHQDINLLPESKRMGIQKLHQAETVLKDKTILIVDDDIRNIFAMTSLLERYQMKVLSAETGKTALDQLMAVSDIDAVLMDIMMPDMDGYDTMRAIRKFSKFRTLPVIALTAKAMKGDREKCIDAGASDYIAKPVDGGELLAMLRLWLYR
ncbi:MAG TPA: response regulator, partial [Verrucomicrobiae bacterium]|nr:response regulator [Verrucomicrobiae bacterium]